MVFPGGTVTKNPPANAGATGATGANGAVGSILGSGRSPGGGNGKPLQYSCLKNSMDSRAWRFIVHGVTKNQTQLSTHTHEHTHTDTPPPQRLFSTWSLTP